MNDNEKLEHNIICFFKKHTTYSQEIITFAYSLLSLDNIFKFDAFGWGHICIKTETSPTT